MNTFKCSDKAPSFIYLSSLRNRLLFVVFMFCDLSFLLFWKVNASAETHCASCASSCSLFIGKSSGPVILLSNTGHVCKITVWLTILAICFCLRKLFPVISGSNWLDFLHLFKPIGQLAPSMHFHSVLWASDRWVVTFNSAHMRFSVNVDSFYREICIQTAMGRWNVKYYQIRMLVKSSNSYLAI